MRKISQSSGFTLLEVLLALVIMTFLSISGYVVLDGIIRIHERHSKQAMHLRSIQRAILLMDKDFKQVIPRTSRNASDEYPMLSLSPSWLDSDSGKITFTRGGWHNPLSEQNRSTLQKVAYRVKNNTLERLYWPYLDVDYDNSEKTILGLLDSVESLHFEAFDNGYWNEHWDNSPYLPQAIRLTIKLDSLKTIQRVYLMQ